MDLDILIRELTLEEKAALCSGEDFWHTKAVERLGIPSVMMCDGPNGLRKQDKEADHLGINESLKAVCFPTESALAASFDVDLARHVGETLGEECRAEEVALLLGPGVNIKRSPLCGRNFEYYSEDPFLSSALAAAYIHGLQGKGVGACIKHFAANNQETRRQSGDSVMDERTFHEIYLASFEQAVKEGKPAAVMCSYNRINGTYAAENRELLTDILRDRWGYEGMVVTDWGAVKDRVKGILAGLDLEMPGGTGGRINDRKIVQAVMDGTLPAEELDKAVRNILHFLIRSDLCPDRIQPFDREADYQVALETAKECAVLLKNERETLPLHKGQKAVFIGGFAEMPRIQGSGSSYINSARVPTIAGLVEGKADITYVRGFDPNEDVVDQQELDKALKLAATSDVAVVFAGLPERFEAEGADRTHMDLPGNQNVLIAEIARAQPNVVVVLANGAPVTMPWINDVSAVLEMYLAGDGASEAAMALLYGESNPCGKLAETFPLRLEDTPSFLNFPGERGRVEYHEGVFVGYRYYDKKKLPVLFPFGHGLSYTSFAYSDLNLSRKKIKDTEELSVSVTIENTGKRPGKEVVQLYVGAGQSAVRRPVQELRGFQKISLAPGERRTVSFTLGSRAFAYYEARIHDWFVEGGVYEIRVGSSSRDIRCHADITVETEKYLPLEVDEETSIGELIQYPPTASLMQQFFGAMMTQAIDSSQDAGASMGGGADALMQGAMEMPIGALMSFGVIDQKRYEELLMSLKCAGQRQTAENK